MSPKNQKVPNIILGITASIAAFKAISLVRLLVKNNFNVKVIITPHAQHFISPLTLQNISGNKVYTDLFELIKESNPLHTRLAEEADLIIIYPATACFISKISKGICDDLLSCIIFATNKKVWFCPAMEENMYNHPIIQENIKILKKIGYEFLGPVEGDLVSGKKALGHIVEEKIVLDKIKEFFGR